jgi:F0F1-type ATP synthase assembly protein I
MYLSWMIAIVLLIPTAIGLFVDRRFGTSPWGVLLFALVGTVLASYGVTRIVLREYGHVAPEDTEPHDADSKEE